MHGTVTPFQITESAEEVNERLSRSQQVMGHVLDLYDIIDLRMLSGLIGELFSSVMSSRDRRLQKNPNIDGYPDLCDVSRGGRQWTPTDYLSFPDGGLEVKNTFGLKRSGVEIGHRMTRRNLVQRQLVWKAHHRTTNNLVALRSDYLNGIPQIVAGYFSSNLAVEDWTEKQQPKVGSTMTSFCQTRPTAFEKLKQGLIFIHEDYEG